MKIQIFCFNLTLITAGIVYAAAVPIATPKKEVPKALPQDFATLEDLSDDVLSIIAADLSKADLARFEEVSTRFQKIAQAEFKNRFGDIGYLWAKGAVLSKLSHAHDGQVFAAYISRDGNIVSIGKNDKKIRVWQRAGKTYKKIRQMTDDVKSVIWETAFAPAEDRLVIGHWNYFINVWDIREEKKINQFNINDDERIVLSPDGITLAVETNHGIIHLYDIIKTVIKDIDIRKPVRIAYCTFSPNGKKLAFQEGLPSSIITVWNLETNARENQFIFTQDHQDLLFLSDGNLITIDDNNSGQIVVFDVQKKEPISVLHYSGNGEMKYKAFSQSGALFAAWAPSENKIIIWNMQSGKILQELNTSGEIKTLKFSPDGTIIVAGSDNGDIYAWKAWLSQKKEAKSTK